MESDCRYLNLNFINTPPAWCNLLKTRLDLVEKEPLTSEKCPFLKVGEANNNCTFKRELPESIYLQLDSAKT